MIAVRERTALRVGELARICGMSADAVRYYERSGLLAAPERTAAGYRLYPSSTIERVRFIQGCQRLGLRLNEIVDLLQVRDTGECPCEPAGVLLRRRLDELDREIARLNALRADLRTMVKRLPDVDCPDPLPGTWCPPGNEGGDS